MSSVHVTAECLLLAPFLINHVRALREARVPRIMDGYRWRGEPPPKAGSEARADAGGGRSQRALLSPMFAVATLAQQDSEGWCIRVWTPGVIARSGGDTTLFSCAGLFVHDFR
jgi:hypothetical protein